MLKPSATIGASHGTVVGGSTPYNSATIPYNSDSVQYGGFYAPYMLFNQNYLTVEHQYTAGTINTVVLQAGMPMGLLLALTYNTTGTIYT